MRRRGGQVAPVEDHREEQEAGGQHRQVHRPVNHRVEQGGVVDGRDLPDIKRQQKQKEGRDRAGQTAIKAQDRAVG